MRERGSWCGETHVQKAVYFLKTVLAVPLSFDFILYRHGPFSFDLRDELTALEGYGLVALRAAEPYGPHFEPTDAAAKLTERFPKTLGKYRFAIRFIGEKLGSKRVAELERLATAVYVTLTDCSPATPPVDRARRLVQLKPHVTPEAALSAMHEIDAMICEANSKFSPNN
jgi:hypothetical protein